MRDPAIHITMTRLAWGLEKLGVPNPKSTAAKLIQQTAPYAIKDRYAIKVGSKQAKKAEKRITAAKITAITTERFNGILHNARVNAGHYAIAPIRKTDSQWATLTEIAALASEFSRLHKFNDLEKGCATFVQLGLGFMKRNYGLNKFKYYKDAIYTKYGNTILLQEDDNPTGSSEFAEAWEMLLEEYTSIKRPVVKQEDKVHVLLARQKADALEADYVIYIRAQFEAFQSFGSVPNLNQLATDNAEERYYQYLAKHPVQEPEDELPKDREEFFKTAKPKK